MMKCVWCKKRFTSKAWNAKACSGYCNLRNWRKNNPEHNNKIKKEWRRRNGVLEFGSPEHRKRASEQMVGRYSNENHPLWKGDSVGYRDLHLWVERKLGKPVTCQHCRKTGLTGRRIHWANKSRKYKRDLDDWLRLCASCHKRYDKELICL